MRDKPKITKVLILVFILFLPIINFSQESLSEVEIRQCENTLSKTVLRGFQIEMTSAVVRKKYPEILIPKADHFGQSETDIYSIVPKSSRVREITRKIIDKGKYAEFDGLTGISLSFVDYKLSLLTFFYEYSADWESGEEFAQTISKKLKLPSKWEFIRKNGKYIGKIECGDYSAAVLLSENQQQQLEPMLSIVNTRMLKIVNKRREDYENYLDDLADKTKQKKKREFKP